MAIVEEIHTKHGLVCIDDSAYSGVSLSEQAKRAAETRKLAGQIMYEAMRKGIVESVPAKTE